MDTITLARDFAFTADAILFSRDRGLKGLEVLHLFPNQPAHNFTICIPE